MNDAVKMAIEALRPFAEIVEDVKESASGLQNDRDDFFLTQIGGYKVADLFTDDFVRAAQALAALEQAGEPVAWIGPIPCEGEKPDWLPDDALCMIAYNPRESQNRMTWEFAEKRAKPASERDWDSATAFCFKPTSAPLTTLQRLGQEFDAGEVKAYLYERGDSSFFEREMKPAEFYPNWKITPLYAHPPQSRVAAEPVGLREAKASFKTALADLGKRDAVQWWGAEDSQHAERMKACKARFQRWGDCDEEDGSCAECDSDMAEALETNASMKRRLRNYEARVDRFFQSDGLRAVQSILATPSQPDHQSRGQAFDGEGEGFAIGDPVGKFTGEAIWHGVVVASYLTSKGKRRYVVEVDPQGFQMIAVPSQLRALSSAKRGEG